MSRSSPSPAATFSEDPTAVSRVFRLEQDELCAVVVMEKHAMAAELAFAVAQAQSTLCKGLASVRGLLICRKVVEVQLQRDQLQTDFEKHQQSSASTIAALKKAQAGEKSKYEEVIAAHRALLEENGVTIKRLEQQLKQQQQRCRTLERQVGVLQAQCAKARAAPSPSPAPAAATGRRKRDAGDASWNQLPVGALKETMEREFAELDALINPAEHAPAAWEEHPWESNDHASLPPPQVPVERTPVAVTPRRALFSRAGLKAVSAQPRVAAPLGECDIVSVVEQVAHAPRQRQASGVTQGWLFRSDDDGLALWVHRYFVLAHATGVLHQLSAKNSGNLLTHASPPPMTSDRGRSPSRDLHARDTIMLNGMLQDSSSVVLSAATHRITDVELTTFSAAQSLALAPPAPTFADFGFTIWYEAITAETSTSPAVQPLRLCARSRSDMVMWLHAFRALQSCSQRTPSPTRKPVVASPLSL